jgi:hypothetical protein
MSKFGRFDPSCDRQVVRGRSEVLADRDNIDLKSRKVCENGGDFTRRFAKAKDQSRFGEQPFRFTRSKKGKTSCITGGGTHHTLKPLDSLHIVIDDIGSRSEELSPSRCIASAVRHQGFHCHLRLMLTNGFDTLRHVTKPTVWEIVASHHREYCMLQPKG